MAENLFNHYADIPELQKETGKILDMFGQVKKNLLDLSKLGIKIDSAKTMAELNAQSKEYEAIQKRLLETQKQVIAQEEKLARLNKEIADGYKQQAAGLQSAGQAFGGMNANIQKQIDLTNKLKELRAGIKKLESFDANVDSPELTAELTKLKEAEALTKAELNDVNKFIRNQAKEFISAADSVDAMKARVLQLTQQYDAADKAFKESEGGALLKQQINDLNAALDKELTGTDRFNQRVGNYAAAAKTVVDELNNINTQLENLKSKQGTLQQAAAANPIGFKQSGQQGELDDITAKITNLTYQAEAFRKATNQPIFEHAADNVKNNTAQVQLLDTTLQELEKTGQKDTEVFKNMKTQLYALLSQNTSARTLVNAFQQVEKEIAAVRDRQRELNSVGFKTSAQVSELHQLDEQLVSLEKEYNALDAIFSKPTFLNAAARIGDATQEVRYFQKSLITLEEAGLKNSQTYVDLQAHLASLTDTIADTRQEVKALSSDTRGFDLAASAVGTLAGAFQSLASVTELFGDDSAQAARNIQKLMAIQNVANGIRQVANDLTTRGTAANKAYAMVQNLVTVATDASATAAARWMAILKGVGILALITALVWVVDKMGLFGSETEKTTNALDDFDAALDITNVKLDQNIQKIQRQIDLQIELAKQQGKTQKDINDITVGGLEQQAAMYDEVAAKRKRDLEDLLAFKMVIQSSQVESLFGISDEDLRLLRSGNTTLKQTQDIVEKIATFKISDTFKDLPKYAQDNVELLLKSLKSIEDAQTKSDDLRFQGTKANASELAREAEERRRLAKQREEEAKRQLDNEKKYAVELANFRLGLEADLQKGIKEGNIPTVSEDAAQKEFALRKKMIENSRDLELSMEKTTASQRQLIREKADNDISNLEAQLGLDLIKIRTTIRDKDLQLEKDYNDQIEQQEKDRIERITKIDEGLLAHATDRADMEAAIETKIAADRFKAGTINEEEYQDELVRIQDEAQRKKLRAQIEFYKSQVNIIKAAGGDTLALEKALAEAEASLSQTGLGSTRKKKDQAKKDAEELAKTFIETTKTIFGAYQEVVGAFADSQKQAIQDQIDNIDRLKEADIQRIQEGTDSEQKKAERIAIIERKAQSDKEALARRQRAIDRQAAIAEKLGKAFSITTDTIVNVNKIRLEAAAAINPAIKAALYAESFIAAAAGAASLVALLATPLPKYAKGGKPKPGYGLIAEDGMELVREKSGRVKLFTQPTLAKFAGDEYIYPYSATKQILRKTGYHDHARNGGSVVVNLNQDEVVSELKKGNRKPPVTIVITETLEATAYYQNQIKH